MPPQISQAFFSAAPTLLAAVLVYLVTTRPANKRANTAMADNKRLQEAAFELHEKEVVFQADEDTRKQSDFYRTQLQPMRDEILSLRSEVANLRTELIDLNKAHEIDTKVLVERLTAEHARALSNMEAMHANALEAQRVLYTTALTLQKSESEKPPEERTQAAADAISQLTQAPAAVASQVPSAMGAPVAEASTAHPTAPASPAGVQIPVSGTVSGTVTLNVDPPAAEEQDPGSTKPSAGS